MKLNKLIISMASIAMLTACGGGTPTSENPGSSQPGSEQVPGETTTETPVIPDDDTYSVKVNNPNSSVTLSVDKTRAKKDETVTVTVAINDPAYKISKVLYDNLECTKVNDTTYTFVMPNHPVKVSCELIVEGDVTIQGEISANFVKEGNVYVARGVRVNKDSEFDIVIKDKNGSEDYLSITDVDRFKTFANINFSLGDFGFEIAGRATYDFYYDTNNGSKPLYVKRVKVDELPSNVNGLEDLFDGRVRSASSVYPDNVNMMTYKNVKANEEITWKAYNDNTTYASVGERDIEHSLVNKANIYTKLDGEVLTVVDNFTPGNNPHHQTNYHFSSDTTPYSGLYKVSPVNGHGENTDNNDFHHNRPYVEASVAQHVNAVAPVTMASFEDDIMFGYSVGFSVEGIITASNVSVTSTPNANGFSVDVVSGKTTDSSKDRNHQGDVILLRDEYRTHLEFDPAGALLNGLYTHRSFGQDKYDFNSNTWLSGDAESNYSSGTLQEKIEVAFTYGDRFTPDYQFDIKPYFVSSLTNLAINNPNAQQKGKNNLNLGDKASDFLSYEVAPRTALNGYQYGIIASSNEEILKEQEYIGYIATVEGQADLTVGIENGLGIAQKVTIDVVGGQLVRNFYINERYGKFQQITSSTSANVFTGQLNEFGLDCTSTTNKLMPIPLNATTKIVGDAKGFEASINHENQSLVINGINAVFSGKSTTFQVQILTPSYDEQWSHSQPATITFTILKGVNRNALIGDWTCEALPGAEIVFTTTPADPVDEVRPLTGTIVCSEGTFQFNYHFDAKRNVIKAALSDKKMDLSELEFVYDSASDTLNAYFIIRDWTVENGQTSNEIFGWQDGENKAYDVFTKKA